MRPGQLTVQSRPLKGVSSQRLKGQKADHPTYRAAPPWESKQTRPTPSSTPQAPYGGAALNAIGVVELVGLPVVDLMAGLAEAVAMGDALLAEAEGMGNATAKVP